MYNKGLLQLLCEKIPRKLQLNRARLYIWLLISLNEIRYYKSAESLDHKALRISYLNHSTLLLQNDLWRTGSPLSLPSLLDLYSELPGHVLVLNLLLHCFSAFGIVFKFILISGAQNGCPRTKQIHSNHTKYELAFLQKPL
jgi:hypothetical protein